ncbi:MAG: signal peptidase II [Verrucomicrobia bacterium]|nr:signal peptidase II [Verrucomicrobiota bacterium]
MNLAMLRVISLFLLAFLLLFVDFISKAACFYLLPLASMGFEGIVVFKNFLGVDFLIQLVLNKGAAWGLFAHFQIPLLIFRIVLILGMLYYLFFKEHPKYIEWPLMLICTGAIGNVVDFFLYGSVVDFLHFNLWGYHFPLFNIADVCITMGIAWLMLLTLLKKKTVSAS